jgi:peptidoglycan/LPS O-acetylase OafA/YrhL
LESNQNPSECQSGFAGNFSHTVNKTPIRLVGHLLMLPKPPKISNYQPQLDGLRGVAILMVFFHHASIRLPTFWDWGQFGVRIFFVLSGYLITLSLWKLRESHERDGQSWNQAMGLFHEKRAYRLLPAFWFALAAGALLGMEDVTRDWIYHVFFLSNFRFVELGYWPGATAHFWSLAVQEQFYLLWPFVIFFLPRRWLPLALGLLVFVAWSYRAGAYALNWDPYWRWIMLPASLDAFAIGAFLAWWKRSGRELPRLPGGSGGVLLAVGVVAVWYLGRWIRLLQPHPALAALPEILEGLIAAYLILGSLAGWKGPLGRLLEANWLMGLGRISYGIFIYHLFVMVLALPLFTELGFGPKQNVFVWSLGTLLLTIIVSIASYYWLEQPAMKKIPQWMDRIRKQSRG